MSVELLFPGTVMVLKSLFKLTIDNHITVVRFAKAMFSFPVDITFLAFSYASAAMLLGAQSGVPKWPIGFLFGFLVVYIIVGVIITALCSKVDKAFDADRNVFTVVVCVVSYVVSIGILLWTITGGLF